MSRVFLGLALLALLKLSLLGSLGVDIRPGNRDAGGVGGAVQGMVDMVALPEAMAQENPAPADDMASEEASAEADALAADEASAEAMLEERPEGMDPDDWAALKRREEELSAKERSLTALEASLDAKIQEMEKLQAELDEMLRRAEAVQDEKVKHLVDVYSNMKAKQAAAVLETLQPELAVKILSGMKGRQAGEILTNVEPVKAAKLSEMLTRMQIPFAE